MRANPKRKQSGRKTTRAAARRKPRYTDWESLQETAYEVGLRPGEFWEITPAEFDRMVAGYVRRINKEGVYFRELYALLYNINRGEKAPAIEGIDVMRLPGEKKPRAAAQPKLKKRTEAEWAELVSRIAKS
ncbi:phage tail assembly chaperone [Spirosoma endbachense]|uniref:Phage tail assembly chaperone n=2 Tax=Spirosoma endbachense TaxID=2666025 RepID=A0A6P1W5C2_9BACT|nr:phage tail assembly chaperone [Spirosoma endbachense]